ncbi:MAG: oligopeptide transporter, OPT family [Ignavibacteria bacterium]|nr:oligopeptide transporter, OPT family [Ignavibacteria bacterium]
MTEIKTGQSKFVPFVSADKNIKEFSFRAIILGVFMSMFISAANAYLGLKAGMTIAATYTTAVIAMAVLKSLKGTILEENAARTIGSIGGNIASGAIFVLPAFFISAVWTPFFTITNYIISTIILIFAGILGIMFVTILRRVLVENAELPFPESIAASEIHKSGQKGARGSGFLLSGMGVGAFLTSLVEFKVIAAGWQKIITFTKGAILLRSPGMAPAYFAVGYIIGPRLGAITFSGGVLAWGLLAPVIAYFTNYSNPSGVSDWYNEITIAWKSYARYIAIGGMIVGAFYTLYKMRKSLFEGIAKSFSNLRQVSAHGVPYGSSAILRTDKDINIKIVLPVFGIILIIMFLIFNYFSSNIFASAIATVVMFFMGFVFAAVSGYLVGIIGVSNNPTSGLTVSVLIIAAFIMIMLGLSGNAGIAAVLGVAAFTCTSVSVAGEMMQDLKAGHILGCTPWKMQFGDIFGVISASLVMFLVLSLLHLGDIKNITSNKIDKLKSENINIVEYKGKNPEFVGKKYSLEEITILPPEVQNEILSTNAGFGGEKLPAPQASLMAIMSKSIIEGKTEIILILTGMLMGIALIMMQVKSPMLIAVGMYLPVDTSFAIFIGGLFKGLFDILAKRKKMDDNQKETATNKGILLSSGLIAGEALIGLLFAGLAFADVKIPYLFEYPSFIWSAIAIILIGFFLITIPLGLHLVRKNLN